MQIPPSDAIGPAASLPAVAATPRPQSPPAPLDTASIGASSPSPPPDGNPWPELEGQGLLAVGGGLTGTIGSMLSRPARRGLQDAALRLQASGCVFEREQPAGAWEPLTAAALVEAVAAEPAALRYTSEGPVQFTARLRVTVPPAAPAPLVSLPALQELDALCGIGDAATPERAGLVKAGGELESLGWRFEGPAMRGAMGAWGALQAAGHASLDALAQDGVRRCHIESEEQLLALDFFEGSGTDHGLRQPLLAARLRAGQTRGLSFATPPAMRWEPGCEAYQHLFVGQPGTRFRVALDTAVSLPCTAAELADGERLEQKLRQAEDIYGRIVRETLQTVAAPDLTADFMDVVMADHVIAPEARAGALARLLTAEGGDAKAAWKRVLSRYRRLLDLSPTAEVLDAAGAQLCRQLRAHGQAAADDFLDLLGDGLRGRTASDAEYAALLPACLQLTEAVGSPQAALEAVDLVRLPAENETPEERLQLLLSLAAREAEPAQAVSDYRALLVHRTRGIPLAAAGSRMLRLLQALGLKGQQRRTAEVFAVIEAGARRDGTDPELPVRYFEQAFVMAASVEAALRAVGRERGGGKDGPPRVSQEADEVVVDGIRVPRRQDSA